MSDRRWLDIMDSIRTLSSVCLDEHKSRWAVGAIELPLVLKTHSVTTQAGLATGGWVEASLWRSRGTGSPGADRSTSLELGIASCSFGGVSEIP